MCAQCYATGAAMFGEAAMLIGGPLAYAGYRRARRALGLRDTAVAPRTGPATAPPSRPATREGYLFLRRPPKIPRITSRTTVRPRLESSTS
jgi:hypothetical protein